MPSLHSHTAFHILFALSLKPRHGYELMQQIAADSNGQLLVGPATLYKTIKELHDKSLIEELPFPDDARRRCYRLTKKGWDTLSDELAYYRAVTTLASQRHL